MIVESIKIKKFRGFVDVKFELGNNITVIAGQNGTQKTTLLGMLSQPFSISDKANPLHGEKPLCGGNYRSSFSEKFKLSELFDKPKNHEWTLNLNKGDIAEYTLESISRGRSKELRFWKKGNRSKGSGYIPIPVIYLSLSRLFPIGEDKDIGESPEIILTEEERIFYSDWHNKILIIPDVELTQIDYLTSNQKKTIGVSTSYYDWKMNSAGQDNIGKILLAILSFKRLKKKFGQNYTGGILVIDELDATLYPASQIKLLHALRKFSSKYDIQIIFTTHSLNILEESCGLQDNPKINKQVRVIFLQKTNDKIKTIQDASFDFIKSKLNNVLLDEIKPKKIHIFTEDDEGMIFCKALIGRKIPHINFIKCSFGSDNLIELVKGKVPGFKKHESIIILDGDIKKSKIANYENIITLPGGESPERLIANYLLSLDDELPVWDKIKKGYNKQIAFGDYPAKEIIKCREKAKSWFKSQKKYWGRGCAKVIREWKNNNQEICNDFMQNLNELIKKYS